VRVRIRQWAGRRRVPARKMEAIMAYELESWQADGPGGELRITSMRTKAVDVHRHTEELRKNRSCVLVTLRRTSQKGSVDQIVWQAAGYASEATPAAADTLPGSKIRRG